MPYPRLCVPSRRAAIFGGLGSLLGLSTNWIEPASAQQLPLKVTKMTPSEQLLHSTVKITCEVGPGSFSYGTGFFFALFPSGSGNVPIIVTNKHVISGATTGHLRLTMQSADGTPDLNNFIDMTVPNFPAHWIPHPDPSVDLTIMPCAGLLEQMGKQGKKPFLIMLDPSMVPTDTEFAELTPLEDILVVGYPNGIIDGAHNIPVFRRGITATPPYIDFNNAKEFLIDASIFPGSSGSPVFLYNQSGFTTREGNTILGTTRVKLLGVVYGVMLNSVTGTIQIIPAPTQANALVNSQVPNNLGVCIKASRIMEFEPIIVKSGFKLPEGYTMRAAP